MSVVKMAHKRSPESLERRRERAARLGYLRAKPDAGHSWIQVRTDLAEPARSVIRSMQIHADHDAATTTEHHYARDATLAATSLLSPVALRSAMAAHRKANIAKHCVSKHSSSVASPSDGDAANLVLESLQQQAYESTSKLAELSRLQEVADKCIYELVSKLDELCRVQEVTSNGVCK